MLTIRLSRAGKRNDPFYHIAVGEKRSKRDGAILEVLGNWYPKKEGVTFDRKKIDEWVVKGAHISPAVKKLINPQPTKSAEDSPKGKTVSKKLKTDSK